MKFQITRLNGKSNAEVLLGYVLGSEPGRIFPYDELINVLSADATKTYAVYEVQSIVNAIQKRLLKEQSRTLYNVRGMGYKLAHATEHHALALQRKDKADSQLIRGISLLRNVRWEEMDPQSRLAHEGSLVIMSGLHAQQQAFDKRLNAIELALKNAGISGRLPAA